MCGIAAIYSYSPDAPPVDQEELLKIREYMVPRGPDGGGLWISENKKVGFGHRRLSIIDLSDAGAQPMASEDGSLVICCNGEIYNYRELRDDLEKRGCRFQSSSDTEVLLHLYAQKGMEMVHDLRGMYAFTLWDEREQALHLVRDPFGIKPLYYADNGKTIRVASQVKALLAGGAIKTSADPAGHVGFFLWGHVPEPHTLYKEITALTPGSVLKISSSGKRESWSFCDIPQELAKASHNVIDIEPSEARNMLGEALRGSIRHHMVADVPVGVFLSSGLDSTTIAALAAEVGSELHTVTLGFEEFRGTDNDEVPLAEEVARQYGTQHQTVWVTKENFQSEYANLLHAMDQPTLDGINSYFVSMAAKKAGLKVALSGLGGDELFGGYPSFKQIPKSVRAFGWANRMPWLGTRFRKFSSSLILPSMSPKYASVLEYGGSFPGAYLLRRSLFMPWELTKILDEDIAREGWRELQTLARLEETTSDIKGGFHKVSALEITWYMRNQLLRDTDWAGMAHSLEVRVPLVDLQLLEKVAPLVDKFGISGKRAMAKTPARPLPDTVLNRDKTGFSVPVRDWLMGEEKSAERGLRGWARHVYGGLSPSSLSDFLSVKC